MATQTSLSLANQIKEDLNLIGTGFTAVDSFDASGNPVLTLNGAADSKGCSIRIVSPTTVMTDSVGNSQRVYHPGIVQWVVEADHTTSTSIWMTGANICKILPLLTKHAVRVDAFLTTHTTAPDFTTITAAGVLSGGTVKLFTIDKIWHPLTASM